MCRRYILVFYTFCWLIETNVHAHDGNPLYFNVSSELEIVCELTQYQNTYYYNEIIHHQDDEVIFRTRLDIAPYISYTITADESDNGTKIQCLRKPCDKSYNEMCTATRELIMNSDQHYSIPEIQYNEDNPTTHVCNISDSERKKLIGTRYHNVFQDLEITVTPADSGSIYFCQKFQCYPNPSKTQYIALRKLNCVRNIYNKKKYLYKSVRSDIIIIGVCAGVVICGILVASFLVLRHCGKKNLTDVISTPPPSQALYATDADFTLSPNEHMEIDDYPGQLTYAELQLAERSPTDSRLQNRIDLPYAQIVGFLAKKNKKNNVE